MVEFGLKLEDNTVEEWKSNYIDYEGLKKLIKSAKKAYDNRLELENRNPPLAADIKELYHRQLKNTTLDQITEDDGRHGEKDSAVTDSGTVSPDEASQNETVSLLSGFDMGSVISKYGSNDSKKIHKSESSSSLGNFIKGVKKGLSFSYDSKLHSALDAETLAMKKFSIAIYKEVAKVNSFYKNVADEIENMLNFLTEQVGPSYRFKKKKKKPLEDMRRTWQMKMHAFSKTGTKFGQDEDGDDYDDDFELGAVSASERSKSNEKVKEADSIKRALTDLHRRAKLLMNYAMINSTGFIKIIKKFTKQFPDKNSQYAEILEEGFICGDGKRVRGLCSRMEQYYANWFCDGNDTEARSLMLPKKGDGLDMDWSQLRLGYRLGMCSILMVWVAWDCIWGYVKDGHSTIGGRTAFPVFRACGGLLLLHWFWGFSVYIWNRYRINYIFLFDFDPRIVDTPIMIFEDATDETLVFLILMLLYYKSGAEAIPDIIPSGGYPFLLVLYTIKCLIFPWRIRKPMWKAIFAVISAPLTAPNFFHTYVADVFTSMVKVFQDIWWTGCFIVSGDFMISEKNSSDVLLTYKWANSFWYSNVVIPLICLFPLWIRFNQCLRRYMDTRKRFPNLANALKYALSQTVTLFGAFHPLYLMHKDHKYKNDDIFIEEVENGPSGLFDMFWFFLFISSSLYSYFWDVYMDWGLGRRKHGLLGSRLMFPNKSYYYYVMVADFFLRFMWVTTLIPPQSGAAFEIPNYLTLVTMAMELLRRTIWGFFRMEHEHRHNTSGFRRVDFVPLHFSTEHDHRYKRKEHVGWSVLGEVMVITAFVVTVSAASVIAAQKATNGITTSQQHSNKDL